jgi:hypothetical protein
VQRFEFVPVETLRRIRRGACDPMNLLSHQGRQSTGSDGHCRVAQNRSP